MGDIDIKYIIEQWHTFPAGMQIAFGITLGLLAVCLVVSIVVSIYLAISYVKFNKKQNSAGMTGEAIARRILDDNGLQNIAVKCSGSMLFGNSYSHYFKKVRLRRRTWKKESVSSLAMASQKSSLAILDKEQDPDMKTRVALTPFIYVGPVALIPLVLLGGVLDFAVFNTNGTLTGIFAGLGLILYVLSFVMSLMVLKTEKKAQERAYSIVRASNLANEEEIEDMKKLFRLYNIEYVNDMITSLLELVLRILTIIAKVNGNSSSSSDS